MKKILKRFLFVILSLFTIIGAIYVYAFFSPRLEIKNAGKYFIYDKNEKLMFQGNEESNWVGINDISPYLINAIISVEDKNFYKHVGFDYFRIIKALFSNIKNNTRIGASTISQQYVKNLFLTFEQTWSRKIKEAFLTIELEVHYSKNEILEGYLNTINFGEGNYGVESASQYYFNKNCKDLTLEEAIILAGIPKNPSNFNPVYSYDNSIKRARVVALSMLNNKYITKDQYDNLFKNEISIYGERKENNSQMVLYYKDAVFDELSKIKSIPKDDINGNLKIYTSFDNDAQTIMEKNILKYISEDQNLQVASIITNPKTGEIISLTGGLNYAKSEYNRALKAKRQVGSTMKSFLYYGALENGMTASSTFKSEKTSFSFDNGSFYSPQNYNQIYANKDITMASAISYSDNIYAVKTNLFLGTEVLINAANKAGIKEKLPNNPSLALGTTELNMIDFANAYNTLANMGNKKDLHFIRKVLDSNNNVLYEYKEKDDYVLNSNYVYILNEMLTGTTNSQYIDYTTPTALSLASKMSRKYSLKTGTTNTDSWVCGYNPDVMMIIWIGNYDALEIDGTASYNSKNIWIDTLEDYLKDKEPTWYSKPHNIIGVVKDGITGEINSNSKNNTILYYVKGTEVINNNKNAD